MTCKLNLVMRYLWEMPMKMLGIATYFITTSLGNNSLPKCIINTERQYLPMGYTVFHKGTVPRKKMIKYCYGTLVYALSENQYYFWHLFFYPHFNSCIFNSFMYTRYKTVLILTNFVSSAKQYVCIKYG
jgi:hypothetical protein